jgi:hypothetical protein
MAIVYHIIDYGNEYTIIDYDFHAWKEWQCVIVLYLGVYHRPNDPDERPYSTSRTQDKILRYQSVINFSRRVFAAKLRAFQATPGQKLYFRLSKGPHNRCDLLNLS